MLTIAPPRSAIQNQKRFCSVNSVILRGGKDERCEVSVLAFSLKCFQSGSQLGGRGLPRADPAFLSPQPQGEDGSEAAHRVRLRAAHALPQREPPGQRGPQPRGSLRTQTVRWESG